MGEDPPDRLTNAFLAAAPRLRHVVGALGFAPADADDLLQRVYLTLQEHAPDWRGAEAFDCWLYRTTVNACRQEYRVRARFQHAVRAWADNATSGSESTPADAARHQQQRELVRQGLIDLDPDLAVPLVLRYFCGWDATRIGGLLDVPPSTVRARLRRGRLVLATKLDA